LVCEFHSSVRWPDGRLCLAGMMIEKAMVLED
jgi:hypothetical protein